MMISGHLLYCFMLFYCRLHSKHASLFQSVSLDSSTTPPWESSSPSESLSPPYDATRPGILEACDADAGDLLPIPP
jgi:hypothetical protein